MATTITWTMAGSYSAAQSLPSQVSSSAAIDFGTDISCLPDLDRSFALISGNRVLAEACVRRITTPRGKLSFEPDYGIDIRFWLRDTAITQRLAQCAASVENEILKDERVDSCEVEANYDFDTQSLSLNISVTSANGTFKLVLNVSETLIAVELS